VNSFTRGCGLGLLALAMLGVTGCSADNETEVEKLSKGIGDPGEGTTKIERADPSKPADTSPAAYPSGPTNTEMPNYPLAGKKK
jgi:hypothetical protein